MACMICGAFSSQRCGDPSHHGRDCSFWENYTNASDNVTVELLECRVLGWYDRFISVFVSLIGLGLSIV